MPSLCRPLIRTVGTILIAMSATWPALAAGDNLEPADEWVERLTAAGVPAGKVRGVLEALTEREAATVEHPTVGSLPVVPSPFGLAAEPPPLLGQHTREVLVEAGYEDEEVAALEAAGVVAG